jgi:hypothetical protein
MRLFLLALLFSTTLFGLINAPVHTPVTSVNEDEEEITITTLKNTEVGMYGAVSHWFNKMHSVALSWVEITKIEGEVTTLKLIPILALEQSALPSGTWKVKVGDDVAMAYNYQRAMLVAPNASIYKKITSYHRDRQWVHPDILASILSSNGHPSPLKEDFTQVCRANNIGTVAFMFDKSIITVDCQSFLIIKNKSTTVQSKEQQVPFYTRVPNINNNWFGDGSDEMENYDAYYVDLLAEHNPQNNWIQKYQHSRNKQHGNNDSWFNSFVNSFSLSDEPEED